MGFFIYQIILNNKKTPLQYISIEGGGISSTQIFLGEKILHFLIEFFHQASLEVANNGSECSKNDCNS